MVEGPAGSIATAALLIAISARRRLEITLEGLWRWVADAEEAAASAIASRLGVPTGAFHVDTDCPVDMDPQTTPGIRG